MKALITAFALLSFVAASAIPVTVHAQSSTTTSDTATKQKTKKPAKHKTKSSKKKTKKPAAPAA